MSKLKRERVLSVQPDSLGVCGVVTTVMIGGHTVAITAANMDAMRDVFKAIKHNEPFDPAKVQMAVHVQMMNVTLDDEL